MRQFTSAMLAEERKLKNSAEDQMTYYLKHYKVAYEMRRGERERRPNHCVLRFIDRDLFFVKMRKREESQRAGRQPQFQQRVGRDDGGASRANQDRKDKSKKGEIREE